MSADPIPESLTALPESDRGRVERVETVAIDGREVPRLVGEYWAATQRQSHSLHEVSYRACFKAELPRFFIERLTEPGDLVLDGFCGSGMTGVAAQWCGSPPADYRATLEARWEQEGRGKPRWGARRVILNDLSPAATFLAANYNLPFSLAEFTRAARRILDEVEAEVDANLKRAQALRQAVALRDGAGPHSEIPSTKGTLAR